VVHQLSDAPLDRPQGSLDRCNVQESSFFSVLAPSTFKFKQTFCSFPKLISHDPKGIISSRVFLSLFSFSEN